MSNEELLPVNLLHWEDDVIMDDSEIDSQKILNSREPKCGWISTQQTRSYQAYKSLFSSGNLKNLTNNLLFFKTIISLDLLKHIQYSHPTIMNWKILVGKMTLFLIQKTWTTFQVKFKNYYLYLLFI